MSGEELLLAMQPFIRVVAYSYAHNKSDVEDFAQEAALLCLTLPTKKPDKSPGELQRIAHVSIKNKFRDILDRDKVALRNCVAISRTPRYAPSAAAEAEAREGNRALCSVDMKVLEYLEATECT